MIGTLLRFASLFLLPVPVINAQTTISPICVNGSDITTFPNCNSFYSTNEICGHLPDVPSQQACLCKQENFNHIFEYVEFSSPVILNRRPPSF